MLTAQLADVLDLTQGCRMDHIDQPKNQPDNQMTGLALEYQLEYGTANRDLNVSDLINNPAASGKCRVNSASLPEHTVVGQFPFPQRTAYAKAGGQ